MFSSRTLTDRPIPDFDLREDFLEDHWGDELKCEITNHRALTCTIEVTHELSCKCGLDPMLVCEAVAVWVSCRTVLCKNCGVPATECWAVRPV